VHDFDASQLEPAMRRTVVSRTDYPRTAAPGATSPAGFFGAKKRPAEAPIKSAKKVCKEGPSKPRGRYADLPGWDT
jgi:hypothetical protein